MGCGCLAFVIALAFPRLAMFILWLFTTWFRGVFDTWIVPVLEFICRTGDEVPVKAISNMRYERAPAAYERGEEGARDS